MRYVSPVLSGSSAVQHFKHSNAIKIHNRMKGTEVPNPRRSSVCDCTCVLTRIDHCLMNNSIMTFALELIWHAFNINSFVASKTVTINYRYSSFTLWAYLCWRHTYCQWPIIDLAKNVSPKNKMAASHVVQIHTHARFLRCKKWPTYHVAVPTGNALASQRSIFRENRLKLSTFIRR